MDLYPRDNSQQVGRGHRYMRLESDWLLLAIGLSQPSNVSNYSTLTSRRQGGTNLKLLDCLLKFKVYITLVISTSLSICQGGTNLKFFLLLVLDFLERMCYPCYVVPFRVGLVWVIVG